MSRSAPCLSKALSDSFMTRSARDIASVSPQREEMTPVSPLSSPQACDDIPRTLGVGPSPSGRQTFARDLTPLYNSLVRMDTDEESAGMTPIGFTPCVVDNKAAAKVSSDSALPHSAFADVPTSPGSSTYPPTTALRASGGTATTATTVIPRFGGSSGGALPATSSASPSPRPQMCPTEADTSSFTGPEGDVGSARTELPMLDLTKVDEKEVEEESSGKGGMVLVDESVWQRSEGGTALVGQDDVILVGCEVENDLPQLTRDDKGVLTGIEGKEVVRATPSRVEWSDGTYWTRLD